MAYPFSPFASPGLSLPQRPLDQNPVTPEDMMKLLSMLPPPASSAPTAQLNPAATIQRPTVNPYAQPLTDQMMQSSTAGKPVVRGDPAPGALALIPNAPQPIDIPRATPTETSPRSTPAERQADGRDMSRTGVPVQQWTPGTPGRIDSEAQQLAERVRQIQQGFAQDRQNLSAATSTDRIPAQIIDGTRATLPQDDQAAVQAAQAGYEAAYRTGDAKAIQAARANLDQARMNASQYRTYGFGGPKPLDPALQAQVDARAQAASNPAGSLGTQAEQDKWRRLGASRGAEQAAKAASDQKFMEQTAAGPQTQADSYAQINARRAAAGLPPAAMPDNVAGLRAQADSNRAGVAAATNAKGKAMAATNDAAQANVTQNARASAIARRERMGLDPVKNNVIVNTGMMDGKQPAAASQAAPVAQQEPSLVDGVRNVLGSLFGGGPAPAPAPAAPQPQAAPAVDPQAAQQAEQRQYMIDYAMMGPEAANRVAEDRRRQNAILAGDKYRTDQTVGVQRDQLTASQANADREYNRAMAADSATADYRNKSLDAQSTSNQQEQQWRQSQAATAEQRSKVDALRASQAALVPLLQSPHQPTQNAAAAAYDNYQSQIDAMTAPTQAPAAQIPPQQMGGVTVPGAPQPQRPGMMSGIAAANAAANAPVTPTYGHYVASVGGFPGVEQHVNPLPMPSQSQVASNDPSAVQYNRGREEAGRYYKAVADAAATDSYLSGPSGFFGHGDTGTVWANKAFHMLKARTGAPDDAIIYYLARAGQSPEWMTPEWRNVIIGGGIGNRGEFNGGPLGGTSGARMN